MRRCAQCSGEAADDYRFCPWCAAPLRLKLVEFFAPAGWIAGDRSKLLRVSRYLAPPDGGPHVRFSVWNEDAVAQAAISLDEEEAARLADFISGRRGTTSARSRLTGILSQLR